MALRIITEANRCLQCKRPQCQAACPIHTPIPQVILAFRENRLLEAGRILFEACHHSASFPAVSLRRRVRKRLFAAFSRRSLRSSAPLMKL